MEGAGQKRHRNSDTLGESSLQSIQRYVPPPQHGGYFKIIQAMNLPDMMMALLPNTKVSIDGGLPHGEWRREGEILYVRWHWNSEERKAKSNIYDPHGGGVMKVRTSDTKYSHVLVPVLVRIGPGGLHYGSSSQFIVTPGGTAIDMNGIAPDEDSPQYIVSAGGTQGSVPRREPDSEPDARGSRASTSHGSRDSGI